MSALNSKYLTYIIIQGEPVGGLYLNDIASSSSLFYTRNNFATFFELSVKDAPLFIGVPPDQYPQAGLSTQRRSLLLFRFWNYFRIQDSITSLHLKGSSIQVTWEICANLEDSSFWWTLIPST